MKEALKLALETLRNTQDYKQGRASVVEAVEDIEAALAQPEERNFCSRCGKRTADLTVIHTCTPPQENT